MPYRFCLSSRYMQEGERGGAAKCPSQYLNANHFRSFGNMYIPPLYVRAEIVCWEVLPKGEIRQKKYIRKSPGMYPPSQSAKLFFSRLGPNLPDACLEREENFREGETEKRQSRGNRWARPQSKNIVKRAERNGQNITCSTQRNGERNGLYFFSVC